MELQKIFICANCNKVNLRKKSTMNKYCNNVCQQEKARTISFEEVINGLAKTSKQVKRFLLNKYGNVCSVCSISDWQGKPITMELEHIDGNSDNNTLENCCLICPNCHSQTSTYKAKNKGNGRFSRRKRYADGKSY